ncbi:helix-turn-helix domain-containing protein, partial [Streptomyces muensis]|nr:helix-turn-helix domain-containing protein [Streptomyces muensis]
PAPPPTVHHPFQTCDGCERAFRSPAPGHCRDCRPDLLEAA